MSERLRPTRLPVLQRRRALRLGIVNAVLWGMGNGLTTGSLIVYLAQEFGARGKDIGLILSLQTLIGVLRLAAPALIHWLRGVKKSAILLFSASYLLLCGLPAVGLDGFPAGERMRFFIGILCVHQLLEGLGTVALWAWLGELVPPRLRGRYFATRRRWQLIALIPTLAIAGWFVDRWHSPAEPSGIVKESVAGYLTVIAIGAALLLASVVPLVRMPSIAAPHKPASATRWKWASSSFAPLVDGRFQRLLLFGCWLSFFNGIMQSAAGIYPKRVLELGLLPMMLLPLGMRLGQIVLTPWVGRFSDRFGNRPTMFVCQALVAFGPLFYLLATPDQPWWLAGAFAVWSAYVGLNICLPNLTLKLSRDGNYAAYTAAYFALSGVAYGIATLLGGWILDIFRVDSFYVADHELNIYRYIFYIAWITRLLALILILGLDEPGAATWRQILFRRKRTSRQAPC